jgi:hypothetical protein
MKLRFMSLSLVRERYDARAKAQSIQLQGAVAVVVDLQAIQLQRHALLAETEEANQRR